MEKIIDIKKFMQGKCLNEEHLPAWFLAGKATIDKLPQEDADRIVRLIASVFLTEVKFGLGILDLPDATYEDDSIETPFFNHIKDLFGHAAHGCYLCDPRSDQNEEEFRGNLCLSCQQKLRNILIFFNLETEKLYPLTPRECIQKSTVSKT